MSARATSALVSGISLAVIWVAWATMGPGAAFTAGLIMFGWGLIAYFAGEWLQRKALEDTQRRWRERKAQEEHERLD